MLKSGIDDLIMTEKFFERFHKIKNEKFGHSNNKIYNYYFKRMIIKEQLHVLHGIKTRNLINKF